MQAHVGTQRGAEFLLRLALQRPEVVAWRVEET
jgi:hypothetical protein